MRHSADIFANMHTCGMAQKLKTDWLCRRDRYFMTSGMWCKALVINSFRHATASSCLSSCDKSASWHAYWPHTCKHMSFILCWNLHMCVKCFFYVIIEGWWWHYVKSFEYCRCICFIEGSGIIYIIKLWPPLYQALLQTRCSYRYQFQFVIWNIARPSQL